MRHGGIDESRGFPQFKINQNPKTTQDIRNSSDGMNSVCSVQILRCFEIVG